LIIQRQIIFTGPSLYSTMPVIQLVLETPPGEAALSDIELRSIFSTIQQVIPAISDAATAAGTRQSGSSETRTFPLPEVVAYAALALQQKLGYQVSHTQISASNEGSIVDVFYEYSDPIHGGNAGLAAVGLVNAALADRTAPVNGPGDSRLKQYYQRITAMMEGAALSHVSRRIIWEAERRGIPWMRVRAPRPTFQLGHGENRSLFRGGYTGETSYLATMLATSKRHTNEFFHSNRIPVPNQIIVGDAKKAIAAAKGTGANS
jgi:hypothetical protein